MATTIASREDVQAVLPQNARVSDGLLDQLISEAAARFIRRCGAPPEDDAANPDSEAVGIVRDLAAARALEKVLGAQSREAVEAAQALRNDALARMAEYDAATQREDESSETPSGYVGYLGW